MATRKSIKSPQPALPTAATKATVAATRVKLIETGAGSGAPASGKHPALPSKGRHGTRIRILIEIELELDIHVVARTVLVGENPTKP